LEQLARELEELGYVADLSFRQQGVVAIKEFKVEAGRFAGQTVAVGIPAADYPMTPPAGIHLCPGLAPVGQNNITQSPLGPGWHYWSRRLTDWKADRSARHVISYVNKVLLDA